TQRRRISSAWSPSGVLRIQEARLVCMMVSEIAEEPAGIEHTARVQLLFQALADRLHAGGYGVEHRYWGFPVVPIQGGMPAVSRGRHADEVRFKLIATQPSQAAVPLDEHIAKPQNRRGRRQRKSPQRPSGEEWMGLVTKAVPVCGCLSIVHAVAAHYLGSASERRRAARKTHAQYAGVAFGFPCGGGDRQRLIAPGIEKPQC